MPRPQTQPDHRENAQRHDHAFGQTALHVDRQIDHDGITATHAAINNVGKPSDRAALLRHAQRSANTAGIASTANPKT